MKKRLVFCFDGTWNRLSADSPTNVVKLAQMVEPLASDGTPQIVYYDEGIGTDTYFAKRIWQGMFGDGMVSNLREAYRFLIFNYAAGDELYIFGFSRGAFTARSFAGFIRHAGILDVARASRIDEAIEIYKSAQAGVTGTETTAALEFRAKHCRSICVSDEDLSYRLENDETFDRATPILDIRYLGVWDTVSALGIPEGFRFARYFNSEYGFHDAVLTSKIRSARHAVALDERRFTFPPTLFGREKIDELNGLAAKRAKRPIEEWQTPYQERWFPGVHGAIGGGGQDCGLSDAALHWVLSGARRAGLQLRTAGNDLVFDIRPDPNAPIFNDPPTWTKRLQAWLHDRLGSTRTGPQHADEIGLGAYQRWHASPSGKPYRPLALNTVENSLEAWSYREPPAWKFVGPATDVLEEYRISERDTLSHLAGERLGDPKRWRELFDLNRDRIDDPDYLPTGVVLRLPRKHAESTL